MKKQHREVSYNTRQNDQGKASNLARTSILPVSGAEQLKTSDAKTTCPICSLRKAYSCASCSSQITRFHDDWRFSTECVTIAAVALQHSCVAHWVPVHVTFARVRCSVPRVTSL